MKKDSKVYLFLFGCIGVRTLLAMLAYKINVKYLPYLGMFAVFVAFGLLFHFIFGTRKTGQESSAENNRIWWNNYRPLHALMYLLFAYLAFQKDHRAYVFLVTDVLLALVLYSLYKTNNLPS